MTHKELEKKFAFWVKDVTQLFTIKRVYDEMIEKRIIELEKKLEGKNE